MIVDDQDSERHQTSVPSPTTPRTRANPCPNQPAAIPLAKVGVQAGVLGRVVDRQHAGYNLHRSCGLAGMRAAEAARLPGWDRVGAVGSASESSASCGLTLTVRLCTTDRVGPGLGGDE